MYKPNVRFKIHLREIRGKEKKLNVWTYVCGEAEYVHCFQVGILKSKYLYLCFWRFWDLSAKFCEREENRSVPHWIRNWDIKERCGNRNSLLVPNERKGKNQGSLTKIIYRTEVNRVKRGIYLKGGGTKKLKNLSSSKFHENERRGRDESVESDCIKREMTPGNCASHSTHLNKSSQHRPQVLLQFTT